MMTGLLRQRKLPQIAFVDDKLTQELNKKIKGESSKEVFPEHEFIASSLRIGLKLNDLKELSYVDVMKILLSFLPGEEKKYKKATQADWDRLALSQSISIFL